MVNCTMIDDDRLEYLENGCLRYTVTRTVLTLRFVFS